MGAQLEKVLASLRKKHGPDIIVKGSDIIDGPIPRCTTGLVGLDLALGGGLPMNQFTEVVGFESSGKTAMVAKVIAANQARDPHWTTFWVAAEGYEKAWMQSMGVDNRRVMVMNENGMEKAYGAMLDMLDTKEVDAIVLDSYPALTPEAEDDGTIDELQVGLHARLTNKFFRMQRASMRRSLVEVERPTIGIFVNQWRNKITAYGDPNTTPGGMGKNFSFYVRLECRHEEWIEERDSRVGQVIRFRVRKNKSAPPQRTATARFYFTDTDHFDAGSYDTIQDIIDVGVIKGVIRQGGAYYWVGDNVKPSDKWKGRSAMEAAIVENVDIYERVRAEVLGLPVPPRKRVIQIRAS